MPRSRYSAEVSPTISQEMRSLLDAYRADYDIGSSGRYLPSPKGVQLQGSGADYHYRDETKFFRAIERARYYDRNNMLAGQAVNRLVANIVQDGFNLDAQTGDEQLDADLEADFWEWADDPEACDLEGEKTFAAMETLSLRAIVVDGDVLCLPQPEGSLQWVEAHRLRRPRSLKRNNVHGVDVDPETGRHTGYCITKEDVDPLRSISTLKEVQEIAARDGEGHKQVLHQYMPNRFSQRRGVTAFAPIVFPLNYHDDLQFAKLVQAQMCSIWGIIETQEEFTPPQPGGNQPTKTGEETQEVLGDGSTRTLQGSSPGMRVRLPRGIKAQAFQANVPNPEFFDHAHLIITILAVNLDMPVHVFLLDPSKTNFSGWRGAIDQARLRFRWIQQSRIQQFHRPIYRWRIRHLMSGDSALGQSLRTAAGKKSGAINVFGHAWHPNAWSYIEPNKDIQAEALEAAICGMSRRRQKARIGVQWSELVPEIVADNSLLILAAQTEADRLNKLPVFAGNEVKLTWRDIAALPMPDGVTLALKSGEEPEEPAPANPRMESSK